MKSVTLVITMLVCAAAVAAFWYFWSGRMEKGLVFFPERAIYVTPEQYGHEFEDVYFETEDRVRLNGWFVKGPDKRVLLWFHGNGGNIADRAENIDLLVRKTGLSVFIVDYREYGKSGGEISKAGTFIDADASYEYLVKERGVDPENLILFGRSLGSALAVYLASKRHAAYLIIESAFTSSDDVADLYFPFLKHLVRSSADYTTDRLMGAITIPKLVIHGENDEIIPLWMGKRLFDLANEPKEFYLIPGATHNDTYIAGGDPYFDKISEFLERNS